VLNFAGNDNVQMFFVLLVFASAYSTMIMAKKCWKNPPELFEYSDDEDEEGTLQL
jgi:hypothetical protein